MQELQNQNITKQNSYISDPFLLKHPIFIVIRAPSFPPESLIRSLRLDAESSVMGRDFWSGVVSYQLQQLFMLRCGKCLGDWTGWIWTE